MIKYPFLDLGKVNEPYLYELKEAACRVIESGRFIGGEEVDALEQELSTLTHAPYAIGVSNGLDALRLILRGYIELGVMTHGDEVIVPANTYIASVLAVSDAGLTSVPVDIDPVTMNIDTSLIDKTITSRTRAVMPVHLYGRVAWDNTLVETAKKHNLKIIEDNAQALGARASLDGLHGSRMTGALGDAAGVSFYPTKNVGALGDAGAVLTHDRDLAIAVRALANYGSDRRYHNIYRGFNCRLDPIQAAMLRVKLRHLKEENAERFARALAYNNTIRRDDVILPEITSTVVDNVWHQYVIRVTEGKRALFRERLADKGVATDIHYAVPPHRQPCYADTLGQQSYPVAERLADEIVSLPIGTGTSVRDASDIGHIINSLDLSNCS